VSRADTVQSNKTSVSLSPEMEREYQLNIDPRLGTLPDGSVRSRSTRTTRDDDQSAMDGDADDVSYLQNSRRASDVPPPHAYTGPEFITALSIGKDFSLVESEGRRHADIEPPGTSPKLYKRAFDRLRLSVKQRLRSKSVG
jgi:hypothetical protein